MHKTWNLYFLHKKSNGVEWFSKWMKGLLHGEAAISSQSVMVKLKDWLKDLGLHLFSVT